MTSVRVNSMMAEKTYTILNPVVLDNDGIDYEQTKVKEVYNPDSNDYSQIDCAQRVTSYMNLNISQRSVVDVTSENVDKVFDEIQNSNFNALYPPEDVNKTIQLYRDLPKDLFIANILSEYHSDETHLKDLRHVLFHEVKLFEEFPFAHESELKRRKKPRLGESSSSKLANDIYILVSVLEGAPFEDMKELISASKLHSENALHNDSAIVPSRDCKDISSSRDADIELLRSLLTEVQTNFLSLKQNTDAFKDEMKEELKAVKDDVNTLATEINSSITDLQNAASECRESMRNFSDDQYNGVAKVRSDIKQIRCELNSIYEYVDEKDAELCDKLTATQKLEKRISRLETKLEKTMVSTENASSSNMTSANSKHVVQAKNASTQCMTSFNDTVERSEMSFQAEPYHPPAPTKAHLPVSESSNVSNDKSKLVRCPETRLFHRIPVSQFPSDPVRTGRYNITSNTQFISGEDDENLHIRQSSSASSTKIERPASSSNNSRNVLSGSMEAQSAVDSNFGMLYQCPVQNKFDYLTLDETTVVPGTISFSDIVKTHSTINPTHIPSDHVSEQSSIPVRLSDRSSSSRKPRFTKPTNTTRNTCIDVVSEEPDDDFIQQIRNRSSRFYVGGFKSSLSEQKLVNYVSRRGITVSWINVRRYEHQDRAIVQLNVRAEQGERLLERGFWPQGVFCRPWYPKNEYRQRVFTNSGQNGTANAYPPVAPGVAREDHAVD